MEPELSCPAEEGKVPERIASAMSLPDDDYLRETSLPSETAPGEQPESF